MDSKDKYMQTLDKVIFSIEETSHKKKHGLKEAFDNTEKIYYDGLLETPFDFKKGLDDLIKADKNGEYVYLAGIEWEQFDFKKGFDALVKIGAKEAVYLAGLDWKQFDYEKGFDVLKNTKYYEKALKEWPPIGIKQVSKITRELQTKSKKMSGKKLSLKEAMDELIGMDAKEIFYIGAERKQFDFKKGLDTLIEKDKTGKYIYNAGTVWKQFDFKKGLDTLIEKDKTGYWIYEAGMEWKEFDYEKGLDALKNNEYYEFALEDWPKGIKASDKEIQDIKKGSTKLPGKKLSLKEAVDEFDGMSVVDIYKAGTKQKNFDFKEGLDALIKADEKGVWIHFAGIYWKEFNFKKGLDAIIKKDKYGRLIYETGRDWKEFNFIEGLNALIKVNKDGVWIYEAGKKWKEFDYKKGLDALKNTMHYKDAKKYWPKNIEQTEKAIQNIKKGSTPFKTGKLKLRGK